jgi:hypothetical protein
MGFRKYAAYQASELILIGTAEGKEIAVPKEKVLFKEDLSANQIAAIVKQKTGVCYLSAKISCRLNQYGKHLLLELIAAMPFQSEGAS